MINEKTMVEAYQPLFDFMSNKYGVTLVLSEMDDIIEAVDKVNENLTELWRIKCDVVGCNKTASCGGMYWKKSGYWETCYIHSQFAREGNPQPIMKDEAIEREKSRNENGVLP